MTGPRVKQPVAGELYCMNMFLKKIKNKKNDV